MTTLPLLALAGYFLCLYEYIAMRHRVICAESDARIRKIGSVKAADLPCWDKENWNEIMHARSLYWNRGTK